MRTRCANALWFLVLLSSAWHLLGETGYEAWLRYEPIQNPASLGYGVPKVLFCAGDSPELQSAREELRLGLRKMLGQDTELIQTVPDRSCIILGTAVQLRRLIPGMKAVDSGVAGSFRIQTLVSDGHTRLIISGTDERGVLYGSFAFLRRLAQHQPIADLDQQESPSAPVRFLNHWDNLDGSIERGYAGRSLFWERDQVSTNLSRLRDYARLMASVGINGCSINNVNADPRVITRPFLAEVARIADVFRPWGVKLVLSIDFASPKRIGGLQKFDPLAPEAIEFWRSKIEEIYRFVPDLAGLALKADSEGRVGPSAYGRTHADAANVIARPLKAHHGLLFYRGFVYDHHMDWRNPKLDRAKAAYDNFRPLDGLFEDNVVVQIKHGPIDFQVREPASPLFGALQRTCEAIELQITQEYTGQQRHLCYLVPMWKEVLDFDLQSGRTGTPVKALVSGRVFNRPTGGFVAVSNVGRDTNWLGNDLALANLYGYGRLAWNPELTAQQIAEEWTRQTFGNDPLVDRVIVDLELRSWHAYENYTGPLGAGTLTDILGPHYGPGVESSERNGWGQWHRADEHGIGMDRTVATGTGFIGQYSPAVAARYESLETCPDALLLFMHHVPYTHVLHSGKTVIQHIYDSHYAGAEEAARFVAEWSSLKPKVDPERYGEVLRHLQYQAGHAIVWRDAINNWFLKTSGIPDQTGRAGHFPYRTEAEDMVLDGYVPFSVVPWETASGGKAVELTKSEGTGSISFRFTGTPGSYDMAVAYYDENDGVSEFKLLVGQRLVDHWSAADTFPSNRPNGHTATRRTVANLILERGEELRLEAKGGGGEKACVDYLELTPSAAR